MNSNATPSSLAPRIDRREAVLGTMPLLILVGFLLAAALFIFLLNPSLGPTIFPLWGLFLVLGVIAAGGASVSLLYAEERVPSVPAVPGSADATTPSRSPPSLTFAREEFGRPVPDVTRSAPASPALTPVRVVAEPWDEDALPVTAVPAAPPITPERPSDISRALDEIADIQRELLGRRAPSSPAPPDAAARA
jgi:hypothetical protein